MSPRAHVRFAVLFSLTLSYSKKMLLKDVQKKLDERIARVPSRGFTREHQKERENEDNSICLKQLAPATLGAFPVPMDTIRMDPIDRG